MEHWSRVILLTATDPNVTTSVATIWPSSAVITLEIGAGVPVLMAMLYLALSKRTCLRVPAVSDMHSLYTAVHHAVFH